MIEKNNCSEEVNIKKELPKNDNERRGINISVNLPADFVMELGKGILEFRPVIIRNISLMLTYGLLGDELDCSTKAILCYFLKYYKSIKINTDNLGMTITAIPSENALNISQEIRNEILKTIRCHIKAREKFINRKMAEAIERELNITKEPKQQVYVEHKELSSGKHALLNQARMIFLNDNFELKENDSYSYIIKEFNEFTLNGVNLKYYIRFADKFDFVFIIPNYNEEHKIESIYFGMGYKKEIK